MKKNCFVKIGLLFTILLTVVLLAACGGKSAQSENKSQNKPEDSSACRHEEITDAAVAATCTEAGKTEGSHCAKCNAVLKAQEEIPATGHTPVMDAAIEATCAKSGKTEGSHCEVCNEVLVKQEQDPVKAHTVVIDPAVAKTCTADGLTEGTHCSVCSTVIIRQHAVPKGHDLVEQVTKKETCSEDGVLTTTCKNCDYKQTKTIAKTGKHTYTKDLEKAATCTEDGTFRYSCSGCDKTYTEAIKAGHTWKNATCTTAKMCSVCQQTEGDALGHNYTDATATKPQTCSRCKKTVGKPVNWYKEGVYKVGTDIPAGEYFLRATSTYGGYYAVCSDSACDDIIENGSFDNQAFVTVKSGQYLELSRTKCAKASDIVMDVDVNNIPAGMYRVGKDIPAGEYCLKATSSYGGYFSIYNETSEFDIVENESFDNQYFVTLQKGQYVEFSRVKGMAAADLILDVDLTNIPSGMYRVGIDIPVGEYYLQPESESYGGYYAIYKETSEFDIVENESFDGHYFVKLEKGQYVEFSRVKALDATGMVLDVDLENITQGLYRVGIDIPAGEYTLTPTSNYGGYVAIYNNATANRDIVDNDSFDSAIFITVKNGQYLELNRCVAVLGKKIDDSTSGADDDEKWSFSEASTLNDYADKATDAINSSATYVNKGFNDAWLRVAYYRQSIEYAKTTLTYLQLMKTLANANATIKLTGGNYISLQELIEDTYGLCYDLTLITVTSSNVPDYSDLAGQIMDVYRMCYEIQRLSVDLMEAFLE